MAESSIWWTTGATGDGASEYTMAQWTLWLRDTFAAAVANIGVAPGVGSDLIVTGATSPLTVATGHAYVHGYPYFNTTNITDFTVGTPVSNTRIDRIVVRASWAAQTVRATLIAGTEGTGNPPDLVQINENTWDIPLYQVSITTGGVITLTDEREYIHPAIAVDLSMMDEDSVDSPQYVDGSIDLAHMSANSVDSDQYVDGSIDLAHMSPNSVDSPQYVDGSVDLIHMSANSVDSLQYVDGSIDREHLEADIIDGTKLADDAVGLEHMEDDSVDSPQYVNGSIDTVHLANDIVDDTKVGNRVPALTRRQGGSATQWYTAGSTDFTPTAVRMQTGVIAVILSSETHEGVVVTFPIAFSYPPIVLLTCRHSATPGFVAEVTLVDTTTVTLEVYAVDESTVSTTVQVNWLAIGPE